MWQCLDLFFWVNVWSKGVCIQINVINIAQWFQFAMLESNKLYKEEMVVHSGWVVAREKLSHTGCPPSPSTPPNPRPVDLPDANRTGCLNVLDSAAQTRQKSYIAIFACFLNMQD